MSKRSAMKKRVRGLLGRRWPQALLAIFLAMLLTFVLAAGYAFLLAPRGVEMDDITGGVDVSGDLYTSMLTFSETFSPESLPLFESMPLTVATVLLYIFITAPLAVGLSGYFLSFLRGKSVKPLEPYRIFQNGYFRAVGGMAYAWLWLALWFVFTYAIPFVILFGGLYVVGLFAAELSLYQLYVFGGVVALSVLWYVVFQILYINRSLAYSLTSVCLAAQPHLPAIRGVRLSRKLMRGCKWRLILLKLSFINYFIPAFVALCGICLLNAFGTTWGFAYNLFSSIITFCWVVVALNGLVFFYLTPYVKACVHAFYIERKREALMDEELSSEDFGAVTAYEANPT